MPLKPASCSPALLLPALCLVLSGMGMAQTVPKVSASSTAVTQGKTTTVAANTKRADSTPAPTVSVPRINAPTMPRTGYAKYPWKTDIVATVFWVGETPTENNPTPNDKSSWDTEWVKNFGGYDDPDPAKRGTNFCPLAFTPGLNPFYIALPYNDCLTYNSHKDEASRVIPWFKQKFTRSGRSVVHGQWLAIRYGNRVCYAQWEDCGPFLTDDHEYVFGPARPKNSSNNGAGIDISPAVRDYLGLRSGGRCDWRFVDVTEVTPGPWRNLGANNPFVRAQQQQQVRDTQSTMDRLQELRRLRDEYFKQNAGGR
ncbi:MAG: hypothetical protein V4662_18060 [Verrucomicrobiota bacterium]